MKTKNLFKAVQSVGVILLLLLVINCSSDSDAAAGQGTPPAVITVVVAINPFGAIDASSHSNSQSVEVSASNLTADLIVKSTNNYEVSIDNISFSNEVIISKDDANTLTALVYVRFSPAANVVGVTNGILSFESAQADTISLNLTGESISITPAINVNGQVSGFGDVIINQNSIAQTLVINGYNLVTGISITTTGDFEVSTDNTNFSNALQIPDASANTANTIYIRFSPLTVGAATGELVLNNNEISNPMSFALQGNGLAVTYNYVTFNEERLAFGGGFNQSATQTFNLHSDLTNIQTVKMYVKLTCPTGGCDEWDVYANVKVLDPDSGELYELGRYITPYWNDNSQLDRGFEFDVTDFKSLLTGATQLRIRTECWNDKGYEVTVDFDYIEGTPDYPYYAVSRVIAYDDWSSSGVPYGVSHSLDLNKSVAVPANTESTHLRTIISGWGHATPNDSGGRPCAEWCYRTHDVKINGANMFQHNLGPLGCATNPVSNQNPGNWQPDRAGWCPGMVVPARFNQFNSSMAGSTFTFEYDYEDWVNDGANGNAYYATSTFVVVKSNTPITKPIVND